MVLRDLKIGFAIVVTIIFVELITVIHDERTMWEILAFLVLWEVAEYHGFRRGRKAILGRFGRWQNAS